METEKGFEVRDMRHKEKFMVDDLYLNGYAKLVGVYGTAVYMSLCRHADKNQQSYPSLKKLAEQHNCSIKQIGRAVKKLEELKIIRKLRLGKKLNNRYLLLDRSEWTNSPITMDSQSNHIGTDSPIHSKETQYKETHNKDDKKKGGFAPPSLSEVKNYCLIRKNNVSADSFMDFYESKGWLIGKNKMKNWQAAVRTWENREKLNNNTQEEVIVPNYAKSWVK